MKNHVAFPELVSGRDDEGEPGPWTLHEGSTMRGGASCDVGARVMEVPLGDDAVARVVRAHELMHARVSPHVHHLLRALDEVLPRPLEVAEECRVNALLARGGFDVVLLRDGTERVAGRRVAEAGDWGEAVCFLIAVLGTGAEREFLAGLRKGRASWMPALRALRKSAAALLDQLRTDVLGATRLNDDGLPLGYAVATLPLARLLTRTVVARVPTTAEELRAFRRSLDLGGRRPATGRFAELVVAERLERASVRSMSSLRRSRPATSGVSLRYPSRLVTDPHRRAFAQRARRQGGIVVIDQSGSMDVDARALEGVLRDAPASLVIGYSHRPGDLGTTANAWLIKHRDSVALRCPSGNVGNGVDGPVLEWALSLRHANEPVIWVTDGQVTDSHDHPDAGLTTRCVELVRSHRIRLVREILDVPAALRRNRALTDQELAKYGRVGRALLESAVKKGVSR